MTTAPITNPGIFAETSAQTTTITNSEVTIIFHQRIARIDRKTEKYAAARQHAKGKCIARGRVNDLPDDSALLEIGRYSGSGAGNKVRPPGVITDFNQTDGRQVAVYFQDFSISGGVLGTIGGDKTVRLLDDALCLHIPVVGLIDPGGAKIQESVDALHQYGRIFNLTYATSRLIPRISIILEPCTSGIIHNSALIDFIIATRRALHMFAIGPDVVRAITSKQINAEDLGGAQVHDSISGVVHHTTNDEEDALGQIHTFLVYLPPSSGASAPLYAHDDTDAQTDAGAVRNIGEIIPAFTRQIYNVVEMVSTVVDHDELVQIQEEFAPSVVVGFACFENHPMGIVTNQPLVGTGTLGVDAFEKPARFACPYDAFGLPVVTFVDVPGYHPGTEQGHTGIIHHGAKVINVCTTTIVPLVTIVLHKAYDDAYIITGSEATGAGLSFCWSGVEIVILGAAGAVDIVCQRDLVKVHDRQGEEVATAERERLVIEYTGAIINPDKAVVIGEIDVVIVPEDTRNIIVDSLTMLCAKNDAHPKSPKGHNDIPLRL